jgi:hypothetical protein
LVAAAAAVIATLRTIATVSVIFGIMSAPAGLSPRDRVDAATAEDLLVMLIIPWLEFSSLPSRD